MELFFLAKVRPDPFLTQMSTKFHPLSTKAHFESAYSQSFWAQSDNKWDRTHNRLDMRTHTVSSQILFGTNKPWVLFRHDPNPNSNPNPNPKHGEVS